MVAVLFQKHSAAYRDISIYQCKSVYITIQFAFPIYFISLRHCFLFIFLIWSLYYGVCMWPQCNDLYLFWCILVYDDFNVHVVCTQNLISAFTIEEIVFSQVILEINNVYFPERNKINIFQAKSYIFVQQLIQSIFKTEVEWFVTSIVIFVCEL